jgi:hypothetical protein
MISTGLPSKPFPNQTFSPAAVRLVRTAAFLFAQNACIPTFVLPAQISRQFFVNENERKRLKVIDFGTIFAIIKIQSTKTMHKRSQTVKQK